MCKFKAERILTGFPAESCNLIKIAICNVFAGTNPAAAYCVDKGCRNVVTNVMAVNTTGRQKLYSWKRCRKRL